ncbi:type II toxin-antitoxin system RelE family toxin [Thermodesulfatator atlanticus]
MWKFKYRKQAFIFLKENNLLEKIRDKLIEFLKGERVDVKRLKGEWKGFLRLRIGRVRVIFRLDPENKVIEIYKAGFRGKIY